MQTGRQALRQPPRFGLIFSQSERQRRIRLGCLDHARKLALDALQRFLRFRFKTHHDHRRSVRRARQTEAIRILDTQTIDGTDLLGTRDLGPGVRSLGRVADPQPFLDQDGNVRPDAVGSCKQFP